MADRVSTIRFRADGAQAVAGSFEQISKKILAQQAMLERAQKVVTQKETGAAMGITQTGLKKAQDQVLAAQKQMQTTIADMDYAAEHSKYDVKMRMLDRQLRETLKKVEGNEQAQLAIRKAYAMESQKLMQQAMSAGTKGGAGGGGGAHGRWQPGAYKTPKFGSMSDRFTAMFSISAMMGNVTGDMTLARNVGVAASGFLLGSPLFGSINAGAIAISSAIAKVREENEKGRKAAQQYNDTLVDMSKTWSGLATGLIEYNPFGSKMQAQIQQTEDAVLSLKLELIELQKDMPSVFGVTGRNRAIGAKESELMARQRELRSASSARIDEMSEQTIADSKMLNMRKRYFELITQSVGTRKESIGLERDASIAKLKLELDYKEKIRQAELGTYEARANMLRLGKEATEQGLEKHVLEERIAKVEFAKEKYEEAKKTEIYIGRQYESKVAINEQDDLEKRARFREKIEKQLESQEIKSYEAFISATKEGYEQKTALRDVAFAVELKKAEEHTEEMVRLVKYMHEQMREEERKSNRMKIENTMASFDAEKSFIIYRRQMKDYGAIGGTPEEQKKIETEMLVGTYNREVERERLTLALKRNQVTKTEADIQSMMTKDIRSQWTGTEGVRIRQAITDIALMRRSIREQDAQDRINELMREQNQRGSLTVGQFDAGKYHAGYVNFAALNQEGQMDKLRQSDLLEKIKEILLRIELAGPLQ